VCISDFGNQHADAFCPRRAPMPSMHTMAHPNVASHKLKHGFSCSIISHDLAERYKFLFFSRLKTSKGK
jgi:hypothetical protein